MVALIVLLMAGVGATRTYIQDGEQEQALRQEDARIVHGKEATKGSLPYQVSVQLNYNNRMVSPILT